MKSGSLARYALTRLALVVPMLLILLTIVFVLMRVAPGDPISAALGGHLTPAQIEERRHAAGFDKPLALQYLEYLNSVFHFNLGTTITDRQSVTAVIDQSGGATLELTVAAIGVALVVGIGLGLLAGRYRDTLLDVVSRTFGIVIYAAPVFFLGFLAQLVFGVWLGWLPTSGRASPAVTFDLDELGFRTHLYLLDSLVAGNLRACWDVIRHLILPATTLGLITAGAFIRLVRVNVIQSLQSDYVEAGRARGLKEHSLLLRHAFRNALVPVVTIIGLQIALLLSGAILTEETFNWPGIGSQLIHYLNNRDYTAVQGIITFYALVVVTISLIIDFAVAWVDPRVRYR